MDLKRYYVVEVLLISLQVVGVCLQTRKISQNTIRVLGFFGDDDEDAKKTFQLTFHKLNMKDNGKVLYVPNPQQVNVDDSFQVSQRVCREIEAGGKVLFGPSARVSGAYVHSVANFLAIPHIQYHWEPHEATHGPRNTHMSINVFPHYLKLAESHADLIRHWKWKKFTVIYQDNDSLVRLQAVLQASVEDGMDVTVRKLDRDPNNYPRMFKAMKSGGETRVVIDCDTDKIRTLLQRAAEVNIIDEYHHFHFTTLDLEMVNLGQFKQYGANITSFRIINPENLEVVKVMEEWKIELLTFKGAENLSPIQIGKNSVYTEVAMLHDAVHLFDKAVKSVNISFDKRLSCNGINTWDDGITLLNFMKTMDFNGMTGRVHFGTYGIRNQFQLDIIEIHRHPGIVKVSWSPEAFSLCSDLLLSQPRLSRNILNYFAFLLLKGRSKGRGISEWVGTWSTSESGGNNITITRTPDEIKEENQEMLANKVLKVVTKTDDPYVFARDTNPDGSIKYTGFAIDILDRISESLNFSYVIYKNARGYGNCVSPGNCDGMIKELVELKADLAVAGMTITYDRERYVDFTKPFLNLGITILIKKPIPEPPNLFSFLLPFNTDVWVYMIAGFLCLSFLLFIIARLTPYEWNSPSPCDPNADETENQFSLLNSLWFCIGCLLQQGSDLSPVAVSTRMVAIAWWFFTLIMVSSYTANLAAFLTMSRMGTSINNIKDLAKQTQTKYGTLEKGSTYSFFEFSQNVSTTYQKVWHFMQGTQGALVPNSKTGIQKVLDEDYAFFAESTTIDYVVQRKCELTQVGGWLNAIGYGIALPENSPYRDEISQEILRLREQQVIDELYRKWWKEYDGGGLCVEEEKEGSNSLTLENVAGVFVVLGMGLSAAVLFACVEFFWAMKKNAREDGQSLASEVSETLGFIMPCLNVCKKKKRKSETHLEQEN